MGDANIILPSVAERLQEMEPSKELLEFYRTRLSRYEDEDGKIARRLSEFKLTCDNLYALEKDLMERDEENSALRKALSDIQACLYQEREHVLRLYSENDRLKIRELEDRKKIQQLLTLCGNKFPSADVHFILKDYPDLAEIFVKNNTKTMPKTLKKSYQTLPNDKSNRVFDDFDNTEFFKLQIDALKAELEEQTKFAKDNIEAVTEDLKVTRHESEAQYQRHTEKIASLNDKLKLSQDLLAKMTEDYLDIKRAHKKEEQSWLAQRDEMGLHIRTLRRMNSREKALADAQTSAASSKSSTLMRPMPPPIHMVNSRAEIQSLQFNLDRAHKMCETYKNQCMKLEDELAQIREERDASKNLFGERSDKLSNQLKSISAKYKDLEKRHKSEVEGFRNDVKILKTHLQKVEKQLLKTAIKLTQTHVDDDMLQSIHQTTTKSKYISDNLRSMKAQIVQLEQELRLI